MQAIPRCWKCLVGLVVSFFIGLVVTLGGWVEPSWAIDPAHQPITEVQISLGTAAGELKFVPHQLEFQAGKRYKLHLTNPSPQKHYFTAKDFADAIWSQKVDAGQVEIKGAIRELELRPKTEADWVFVPMKAGQYGFRCTIAGHTEAGMQGTITITD